MGICQDRVVIVTGAGGGLGRGYALAFAAEGAKVVVNDINVEAAQKVVDDIKAAGGEAIVNSSDITNYDESINAVKQAVDTFGDLHVVVNNAVMPYRPNSADCTSVREAIPPLAAE